MSEWLASESVRCVSCPDCAFTFDAGHTDEPDGGYSCPACAELRLEKERDRWKKEAEGRKAFTSRLSQLARRSESRAARRLNVQRELKVQAAEEHMRRLALEQGRDSSDAEG